MTVTAHTCSTVCVLFCYFATVTEFRRRLAKMALLLATRRLLPIGQQFALSVCAKQIIVRTDWAAQQQLLAHLHVPCEVLGPES